MVDTTVHQDVVDQWAEHGADDEREQADGVELGHALQLLDELTDEHGFPPQMVDDAG